MANKRIVVRLPKAAEALGRRMAGGGPDSRRKGFGCRPATRAHNGRQRREREFAVKLGKKSVQKSSKRGAASPDAGGFSDEERAAMAERAKELKAARRRGSRATNVNGEKDLLAENGRDAGARSRHGGADPRYYQSQRAKPLATHMVRDARLCAGGLCHLLFPKRAEVQDAIRNAWLQRQGERRRRSHGQLPSPSENSRAPKRLRSQA